MINALEVYRQIKDQWDKTSQPLKERASVLPLGQYEDGSVGLAWPGLIAQPAESWKNMMDVARYGTPYEQQEYMSSPQAARDSFDAAGLAMTGGLGVGLAGGLADNALGSAGAKLTGNALERSASDLPMDLASRMARAREMGFDTDNVVYHGTRAGEFPEFMPSKGGTLGNGVYLADNAADAGDYARFSTGENGQSIMPLMVRGKIADMEQYYSLLDESLPYRDAQQQAIRKMQSDGYSGLQFGGEISVFDPRNIRSTSAAFDPAKSDSANLLAANAKTGAAVPLAMNALERAQPQGIRAYHGSPHDFDRFSLDKIGTGEGAQAYGHGLYFAENEGVARSYRDTISQVQGSRVSDAIEAFGKTAVDINGGDVKKAIEYAKKRASDGGPRSNEWAASVEFLNTYTPNKGRMYEVNIKANPEDFLDWDKPLSQQSEKVRNALQQRFANDPIRQRDMEFDGGNSLMSYILRNEHGPDTTQALREAGIPGIKYLDGMSRNAGQGSSNYVVFDDQLVDILRKYANAPTGAVVPAGMQAAQQETSTDPALLEYLKAIGLY